MGGRFRSSDGDWICTDPECANLNFARRTACNRCGKEKVDAYSRKKQIGVEIGKAAAEKSRGLFSADDWQCTKCGNVNWARRQQCNMCNAPKFGEVEERTGYGGGYNDRGVVEYIEREESDDEYDEFGRKKKKFRKINPVDVAKPEVDKPKAETVIYDCTAEGAKVKFQESEYDDEEDEDEEGDLSKYDLSEWGDVDDVDGNGHDKKTDPGDNVVKAKVKSGCKDTKSTECDLSTSTRSSRSPCRSFQGEQFRNSNSNTSVSPTRSRSLERDRSRSPIFKKTTN